MSDLNKLFDEAGYFEIEDPVDDRGEFRKGATSALSSTVSGGKALIGGVTGNYDMQRNALLDMEQNSIDNAGSVAKIEDIDSMSKFGDWFAYNLGSGTASIGTAVVGGGLGGLAVKGLAKGALVNAGRTVGAGTTGLAPNFGESLNNAYDETGQIENQAAAVAGVVKASLDMLVPLKLLRGAGKGEMADRLQESVKQRLVKDSGFKTWARDTLNTGTQESLTEGAQTYVDQVMRNVLGEKDNAFAVRDISEIMNAAASGAAGSMGAGQVSGYQAMKQGQQLKQQSIDQNAYADQLIDSTPLDPSTVPNIPSVDQEVEDGNAVDLFDVPTVARNQGVETRSALFDFGNDFTGNAPMRQGNAAAQKNPMVPINQAQDSQPNFVMRDDQMGMQTSGGLGSQGFNINPYEAQPLEGEFLGPERQTPFSTPVGQTLGSPITEGEFENQRALPDRSQTIAGQDGRPIQDAQQQADNIGRDSQNLIPQKDIIFAEDNSGNKQEQPTINLKTDGTPFGGKKAAALSKGFKEAKKNGLEPQVVPVMGGYGWESNNEQITEISQPVQEAPIADVVATDDIQNAEDEKSIESNIPATTKLEKIFTPKGREVEVDYQVVEADDLIASNDDVGNVNPSYPQTLQPRDRTRASSQLQINDIANNINPALLDRSANTSDGAPIVSDEGIVESGNGRTLALKRAYEQGKAVDYKTYLSEQGYDVQGMDKPVLVRVRRTEMNDQERQDYTKESNERSTLSMSASEMAKSDAKKVMLVIGDYAGGDVSAAANRSFVTKFMQGAVSKTEQAAMIDKSGQLSQDGRRRVEAALIQAAYGDGNLVNDIFESSDSEIRAIGGALLDTSGSWAQMRSLAEAGQIDAGSDITQNVVEAINLIKQARTEGRKLGELVNQGDIFSGDVNPMTKAILTLLYSGANYNRARSRKAVTAALYRYTQLAEGTKSGGLFSDTEIEPVDAQQLLEKANEQNTEQENGKATLLAKSNGPNGQGARGNGQDGKGSNSNANSQTDSKSQEVKKNLKGKVNTLADQINSAANEAATSPTNDLADPTDAQKEAGNYKKGKIKLQGLDISIENPKGSTRSGKDESGKEWKSTMQHHYGDIKGTTGADGDSIDTFIGDNPESNQVFVVDQVNPKTGEFDEHKVMIGFDSIDDAKKAYLANYEKNWKGLKDITKTSIDSFKEWMVTPRKSKQPFAKERRDMSVYEHAIDSAQKTKGRLDGKPVNPILIDYVEAWNEKGLRLTEKDKKTLIDKHKAEYPSLDKSFFREIAGSNGFGEELLFSDKGRKERSAKMDLQRESESATNPFALDDISKENRFFGTEITHTNEQGETLKGVVQKALNGGELIVVKLEGFNSQTRLKPSKLKITKLIDSENKTSNTTDLTPSIDTYVDTSTSNIDTSTPIATESEYHYKLADKSYANSSRSGAKAKREGFVKFINAKYQALNKNLNPEQTSILDREIIQLKKDYLEAELPALSAQSGVVSAFIAGKSNFNFKQSESRGSTADKAWEKFGSWQEQQEPRIAGLLSKARNTEQVAADKAKADNKKLTKAGVDFAGRIGAINSPGMDKTSLRKSASKAWDELSNNDPADVIKTLNTIDGALIKDGTSLAQAIGERSQLYKDIKAFIDKHEVTAPENNNPEATLKSYKTFWDRYNDGDLTFTVDEIKQQFNLFRNNEAAIVEELEALTIPQLKDGYYNGYHSGLKKSQLVKSSYESLVTRFGYLTTSSGMMSLGGYKKEDRFNSVSEKLDALTDEKLLTILQETKAERDEQISKYKKRIEGVGNPKTLDDFRNAARLGKSNDFTSEQWAEYDRLHSDENLRTQAKLAVKTVSAVTDDVSYSTIETTHSKKGHDLFVVSLDGRVNKELYTELNTKAKSLGGYYSSFNKQGAIPGFQFRSEDDRQVFIDVLNGKSVEKTKEAKDKTESLENLADRIEERANETLGRDRKTNTSKRSSEAARTIGNAESDLERAAEIRTIALAIKDGKAKYLTKLSNGTEQELLSSLWNRIGYKARSTDLMEEADYGNNGRNYKWKKGVTAEDKVRLAEYPLSTMSPDSIKRIAQEMEKTKGYVVPGRNLLKVANKSKDEKQIFIKGNKDFDKLLDFVRKHQTNAHVEDVAKDFQRLQRMGIKTLPMLRSALLEYDQITSNVVVAKVENATTEKLKYSKLQGKYKDTDFFNSTSPVVKTVIDFADIKPGMKVLEPSAGAGHLADGAAAIVGKDNVDTVEFTFGLQEFLTERGYKVTGGDFLAVTPDEKYDRIVMNPPFSNDQEITHVEHAYKFLKPGGRLVAVTSSMAGNRSNKRNQAFTEWMDSVNAEQTDLPEGSFKDAINPTSVNAKVIVVDKPDVKSNVMFNRSTSTAKSKGVTEAAAKLETQKFLDYYKGLNDKDFKQYVTDKKPSEVLGRDIAADDNVIKGAFDKDTNTLYIFSQNHESNNDIQATLREELLTHKGLGVFKTQEIGQLITAINDTRNDTDKTIQKIWKDIDKNYADATPLVQAEEFLGKVSQEQPTLTGKYFNKIVAALVKLFRKAGFVKPSITMSEMRAQVYEIGARLKKGQQASNYGFDTQGASDGGMLFSPLKENQEANKKGLDMSKDARMERAKQMGFNTKLTLYHGTDKEFDAFSNDALGSATSAKSAEMGFFFASRKKTADYYSKGDNPNKESSIKKGGTPKVLSVLLKEENPFIHDSKNKTYRDKTFASILSDAKENGHDSVIFKNAFDAGEYGRVDAFLSHGYLKGEDIHVVFNSNQIRSVDAAFDPDFAESSNLRFNRSQPTDTFEGPREKRYSYSYFKRKIQDKFLPIKEMQVTIEDFTGNKISDDKNVYLAEELYYGKTENDLKKIEDNHIKPLTDAMIANKVDRSELDTFVIARHAQERNAYIASINPELPDGGSGMTNQEAIDILQAFRTEGKFDGLSVVAREVYKITNKRRALMRESGLEDSETMDILDVAYQFYVPLKGYAEDSEGSVIARTGKGFDIRGRETMQALGRRSLAESPTGHAISDLTTSVIRARKNEVGQAMLKLVNANPNKELWEVFTNANPDTKRAKVNGVVKPDQPVNMAGLKDVYFAVKIDGEVNYIKFKDKNKLLLHSMRNMGAEEMNTFTKVMSSVTRWLSMVNTSLNPEFTITNFTRDIQTALFNALAEQDITDGKVKDKAIATKMVKGTTKAVRALWQHSRGTLDQDSEISTYITEFLEDGAKTGYFDSKDVNQIAKDLESQLNMGKKNFKGNLARTKKTVLDFVEHANSSIENGVRLSAYIEARKANVSRVKSASFAKNLTVNFNRKGEMGTLLNSLFMFFNAAVQGNANFARAILTPIKDEQTGKRKLNRAQKIAGGITMSAVGFALLSREMGGEDEDGEPYWDKIPKGVRERNLVILKSLLGGEPGEYWKVPLPYGYNIFYNLGDAAEAAVNSKIRKKGDLLAEMALSAYGSFIPLGSPVGDNAAESLLLAGIPTIGKPAVELAINKNFFGGQIYRENLSFGPQKADAEMSMRSTPEAYKVVSKFMNEFMGLGGGSEYKSGYVDISPDSIEHMMEFTLGGLYRFSMRATDNANTVARGGNLELNSIPFARQLNGQIRPFADISSFYDARQELKNVEAQFKSLQGKEKLEYRQENIGTFRLKGLMKISDQRMKALREKRDRIESDDSLAFAERERQLDVVQDQMKETVARFNSRYNKVK